MDSGEGLQTSLWRGCPIRILKAHRLHATPLERFAGLRVLHRTDAPRHPPRTLSYLWEALAHLSLADFASFAHTCLWLRFGTLLALLPSALGKIEDRLVIYFSLFSWKGTSAAASRSPTGRSAPPPPGMWKAPGPRRSSACSFALPSPHSLPGATRRIDLGSCRASLRTDSLERR